MENEPWQLRARAAGLTQAQLAKILGIAPSNLSTALRGDLKGGVPRYLQAFIIAWEVMTADQRAQLQTGLEAATGVASTSGE